MKRFEGKNILITGGTSGIGLATAKRVVDEGGTVLVTGRDQARLTEAGNLDGVSAVASDAADPAANEALRAAVDDIFGGRLDGVFLNAGLGAFAPVEAIESDEFDRQFSTNVRGPFLQLRALESALGEGSSVLLNTSIVNDVGMPSSAVYSATKGAVRSGMNVFANELAPRQIRVNAVSPGPIDTAFFAATGLSEEEIQGFVEQVLSQVPLGRFGAAEEVAAGAAFLLSDDASFVTGTELVIDGGMS